MREIYPKGVNTEIDVPGLSTILCGHHRPGHFKGVATVVTKLLNIVQPEIAVFGNKDYQQLQVIRTLVTDLLMPVEIIGADTTREPSGLAMSLSLQVAVVVMFKLVMRVLVFNGPMSYGSHMIMIANGRLIVAM